MKKVLLAALVLAPAFASAQQLGNVTTLLQSIGHLVSLALPIVVGLALLAFFWGLVKFIFSGGEDKEKGRKIMIWGVVALFVMVCVWGLVTFLANAFGINQTQNPGVVPTVQGLQ